MMAVPTQANSSTWTICFVLGAPGAGKGTQCAKIVEKYGWQHLSTGDLLRAEVAAGSELGVEAQALMHAGEMVPTRLVLDLLSKAMANSGAARFLVDGFPRKLDQLQEFEAHIQPADYVLVFTLPEEVAVERLVKRGETSGRADDNEATIRSRMQVFAEESQPVIDALKESGRVAEIDSQGDVEAVFASLEPVMDELQAKAGQKEDKAATAAQAQRADDRAQGADDAEAPAETAPAAPEEAVDAPLEEAKPAQEGEAAREPSAPATEATAEAPVEEEQQQEPDGPAAPESFDEPAVAEGEAVDAEPGAAAATSPPVPSLPLPPDVRIVFVLGAPGAGKGTQCARIVEEFGCIHLSTGDLLRAEVAAGSPLGQQAAGIMQAGGFVPTALICDLLVAKMAAVASDSDATGVGAPTFLIDGFPRKLDQLQEFETRVRPADYVLVFTLPEDVAVERLVKRGETSGRADDNEATIRSRMQAFVAESQPVIDSLKAAGRGVAELDSSASVDAVSAAVRRRIQIDILGEEPDADDAEGEEQQQETPAVEAPTAVSAATAAPAPPAVLPAKASPAVATAHAAGLPVRAYMDATVVPVLRDALRALNEARPADPLAFLSDQLLAARARGL